VTGAAPPVANLLDLTDRVPLRAALITRTVTLRTSATTLPTTLRSG
jgi:hypothetical protein